MPDISTDNASTFGDDTLHRAQTERRIDDWLARLDALMHSIVRWACRNGWTANLGSMPLHEALMGQFAIEDRSQPALTLNSPGGALVLVKPKGRWVIGANGRVDIYSPKGACTLIDVAEPFEPPQWTLHHVGQTQKGRRFTPELLAGLV